MGKKILGIVLLVLGGLSILGSSLPENSANAITIIATILMVATGILLITFDSGARLDYYMGYSRRKIQNVLVVVLLIPCFVLFLIASGAIGIVLANPPTDMKLFFIVLVFVSWFLYAFPTLVLGIVLAQNTLPFNACKKHIPHYNSLIEENLVIKKDLSACSDDGTVMANDSVIFFPKHYCMIPFEMIESYKYSNPLKFEPDVFLKLKNGKTVLIVNKNFGAIKNVIDAHRNNP